MSEKEAFKVLAQWFETQQKHTALALSVARVTHYRDAFIFTVNGLAPLIMVRQEKAVPYSPHRTSVFEAYQAAGKKQ